MTFDFNDSRLENLSTHTHDDSSVALSQQTFGMAKQEHDLRGLGIATGAGFVGGAALTAGAELAAMKTAEAYAKPLGMLIFGAMGGGRFLGPMLAAPALTAAECITPKYVLAGGLVAATAVAGGYEFYKYLQERS